MVIHVRLMKGYCPWQNGTSPDGDLVYYCHAIHTTSWPQSFSQSGNELNHWDQSKIGAARRPRWGCWFEFGCAMAHTM